jgi:hypothetical protein
MAISTKPIEQTAGLLSKTQLSVSEVQAFFEASLDPAPMAFFAAYQPAIGGACRRIASDLWIFSTMSCGSVAACISVRSWRLMGRGLCTAQNI